MTYVPNCKKNFLLFYWRNGISTLLSASDCSSHIGPLCKHSNIKFITISNERPWTSINITNSISSLSHRARCYVYYLIQLMHPLKTQSHSHLTLILLTWRIWWAPNNASKWQMGFNPAFNPLNPELNPICYLLALLAHHFLHVSRIMVKSLTLRLIILYIYIYDISNLRVKGLRTVRPVYRTGVPLPSRCCILYIFTTTISTEYFNL